MKLIFFTPAIKRSAIGRMGALVVRELIAQGHSVTVIRTEAVSLQCQETHDFGVKLIPWNKIDQQHPEINSADQFIYQVGNCYEFHEGCMHWMPVLPGIVCLHDFFLGHLFYAWSQSRRQEADGVLRTWYGQIVAESFFSYTSSEAFIEGTRDISPLTEWVSAMALGVITHSPWGCERVLRACPGPVHVVPLAYDAPSISQTQFVSNKRPEEIQLLTIGHINPNKRVESVIRAIASNAELKNRIVYKLVGHIEPDVREALLSLAQNLGVRIVISGEVDDATLVQAIAESDVVSCLRWPILEAASASAIEAMLYGKATICTDAGFYSEIPDDCVFKISIETEIGDISACLTKLIQDPILVSSLGEKAQIWASNTFSAANYARSLSEMSGLVSKAKPVIDACRYFSMLILRWSGDVRQTQILTDKLSIF